MSATPELFPLPPQPFRPPNETSRQRRQRILCDLIKKHGIVTNGNGEDGPAKWIAFSVPQCHASRALKGYLTPELIRDPWEMYIQYCRLMEEAGLIFEGSTRLDAVKRCADSCK